MDGLGGSRPYPLHPRRLRRGTAPDSRYRAWSTVLEEVPDGEFEQVRIVDRPPGQGEPHLESQGTQGGEPADPHADAVEQAQRQGPSALGALEEVLLFREHVAGVEEGDAAEPGRPEQRELDLPVGDQLLVAAHREVDDAGVELADDGDLFGGRDAAQGVAADGVDAALVELLADGHRMIDGVGGADVADRDVGLEDQAQEERAIEALDEPVALEEVLAAEERGGELRRRRNQVSVGGEQAVVALVVVEREPDAGGAAGVELV